MSRTLLKDKGSKKGSPAWMTTYADMTTLLLCFFVLLYTYSTIDVLKFREVVISLKGALGVLDGGPQMLQPGELPAPARPVQNRGADERNPQIDELALRIARYFSERGMEGVVELEKNRKGLVIRFKDATLFDFGMADIRENSKPILSGLAEILNTVDNEVTIEGHTDNVPIKKTHIFKDNWELSTARSCNVLRFFIDEAGMAPERLSAIGYGEYKPIVPNNTEENRQKNRRVDVVVLVSEEEVISGNNPLIPETAL